MIHITKVFYKLSKNILTLSKVRLVSTKYKLRINIYILSVIFAISIPQEYQLLSSHNYQFSWYYINLNLCHHEMYISILYTVSPSLNKPYKYINNIIINFTTDNNNCYSDIIKLLTVEETYTGNPCFIKPNIDFIISPSIDVPYIDLFLCYITNFYIISDRVRYCTRFKQQNITYGCYFDSHVPYHLYLISFLNLLVKLCAIITSLNHILDIIFIIPFLCLYTYNFQLPDIMYLIIIISAQNLYINAESQCHINSVLTKGLQIFKCIHCIHCNCICGNLLLINNVVNCFNLIQDNNNFPR